MYAGALPLLLAAAGLVARRPRGPQLFFAGLAVVSLAIALDTGPFSRAIHDLPVLDQAALARVLILASFAIAMLAAFGLQLLLTGTAAERRRMLIAASVVAVLPALVVVGAHPQWLGVLPDGVKRVFGAGAETVDAVALASVLRWLAFAAAAIAVFAALGRWRHRTDAADRGRDRAGRARPPDRHRRLQPGDQPGGGVSAAAAGGRRAAPGDLGRRTRRRRAGDAAEHGLALGPRRRARPRAADGRPGRAAVERARGRGGAQRARRGPRGSAAPKLLDVFGVRAILLQPSVVDRLAAARRAGRVLGPRRRRWSPTPARCRRRSSPTAGARAPAASASALLMAAGTARQARDAPVHRDRREAARGDRRARRRRRASSRARTRR